MMHDYGDHNTQAPESNTIPLIAGPPTFMQRTAQILAQVMQCDQYSNEIIEIMLIGIVSGTSGRSLRNVGLPGY
jgi:hypothetical protein